MQYRLMALVGLLVLAACGGESGSNGATEDSVPAAYEPIAGFIDAYWDADDGRLLLQVEKLDEPFLYQSSLARGVGSNWPQDPADRGQPCLPRTQRRGWRTPGG
jgi:hypothetical protein